MIYRSLEILIVFRFYKKTGQNFDFCILVTWLQQDSSADMVSFVGLLGKFKALASIRPDGF